MLSITRGLHSGANWISQTQIWHLNYSRASHRHPLHQNCSVYCEGDSSTFGNFGFIHSKELDGGEREHLYYLPFDELWKILYNDSAKKWDEKWDWNRLNEYWGYNEIPFFGANLSIHHSCNYFFSLIQNFSDIGGNQIYWASPPFEVRTEKFINIQIRGYTINYSINAFSNQTLHECRIKIWSGMEMTLHCKHITAISHHLVIANFEPSKCILLV